MTYKDVLNDNEVKSLIDLVDQNDNNGFSHGLKHILNVVEIIEDLAELLNIDETTKKHLLIACVFHDVGILEGKEEHAKRSADFASKYLKNKVSYYWYNEIVNSIRNHHEKNNLEDLNIFSHILLFADKMDFTRKRLDFNYFEKNKMHMFEEHILNVTFKIENDEFIITIKTDKAYKKEELDNWAYFKKLKLRMKTFSRKINKNLNINFD